jgi:beta-aspartyl-peptidase (threonine type)
MTSLNRAALALVCAFTCACAGPPGADAGSPLVWAGDEAAIRAATAASAEAWNRGDIRGHLAIYDEAVTFMTANGPRPGVAAIEASFLEKYFEGGKPKQELAFSHISVRRLGPDAAMETGRFLLSGGALPEQSGWFTLVWLRTPSGWRAVHDHSS